MRRENQHALIQLGVALATGIAAYLVAPRIHSTAQHREFVDFFVASASVIAALLIALAVEARSVSSTVFYALVTAATLAIGEVSAVAALSPTLPAWWIYRVLFALTVGGGIGGLTAIVDASAKLLLRDIHANRDNELQVMGKRSDRDKADAEAGAAKAAAVGAGAAGDAGAGDAGAAAGTAAGAETAERP